MRGVYAHNEVYAGVQSWNSFEPWLSNVEKMEADQIWAAAADIPPDWYGGQWAELEKLVCSLIQRRNKVRELIMAFRLSQRKPFPHWTEDA